MSWHLGVPELVTSGWVGRFVGGMGIALSPSRREEIMLFDSAVSGESVSQFCRRVGIGRSSFYRIEEQLAVLDGRGCHVEEWDEHR